MLEDIGGRTSSEDDVINQADKDFVPLVPNINQEVDNELLIVESGIDPTQLADLLDEGGNVSAAPILND